MKLFTVDDAEKLDIQAIHTFYKSYINSSKVNLLSTFGFGNDVPIKAEGMWITLNSGEKILDFTGGMGVLNHGHNHPRILKVRKNFQNELRLEVHKSYFSKYVAALSHNIAQLLPGDLKYSYFPNSGAEAVDAALKTALKYHSSRRDLIIHSNISFHGKLFGADCVTSSPVNHHNFPKTIKTASFEFNNIDSVKSLVKQNRSADGSCNIAGLIIEPMNVSNLIMCTDSFLEQIRELCYKEDIVLIYDEVYSGWCKTGHLFNFMRVKEHAPDILLMAKSFGGGKASISGIVINERIYKKTFDNLKDHNILMSTFFSFGEETLTAIEAVNIIVEENYQHKAFMIGEKILPFLEDLKSRHPKTIKKIQGSGAMFGVFFESGPSFLKTLTSILPGELLNDSNFLNKLIATSVVSHLYDEHKILTFIGQGIDTHLIVSPSLITSEDEIEIFKKALSETMKIGIVKLVLKFVKRRYLK